MEALHHESPNSPPLSFALGLKRLVPGLEPLLVLRVPVQKNLSPPGMDMERRMPATEEREGCCAGRRSSKYPSKQKGTWRQTEGQGTEADMQLQLPGLQSPLLPERPYLGRENRE